MTLWIFATLAGLLAATGVYLAMAREALRLALGLTLIGTGANLAVFAVSGATQRAAPLIPLGADAPLGPTADPLPQALVLTAIVIGFGLSVFAVALAAAARRRLGTDDVEAMRAAEPISEPHA